MKKNMFYTAAMLLAGAVMVACSGSEDIMGNNTTEPQAPTQQGAVVLKGTLGSKGSNDNETRGVSATGVGYWVEGDQFAIYYQTNTGHATAVATINSVNDNGAANFTATLYNPKAGNSDVTLVYPAFAHDGNGGIKDDALAEQNTGTNYNHCDVAKALTTLSVEEQDGKAVKATLNSDVTMEMQVADLIIYLNKSDGTAYAPLERWRKFEVSDGTHTYTVTQENLYPYEGGERKDPNTVALFVWPVEGANFTFTATEEKIIYTKLDGVTLANCGLEHIGCVIDKDGNIYSASLGSDIVTYSASFSNKTVSVEKAYRMGMKLTANDNSDNVIPVAMIAYVGEAGSADASSSSYRGLAISMNECDFYNSNGGNNFIKKDGKTISNTPMFCSQASEFCTEEHTTNFAEAYGRKNGIDMTTYLISHSTGEHNHYAAKAARAYSVVRPAGCSDWFLPSIGQWDLIVRGLVTKKDGLEALYSTALSQKNNDKMKPTYFYQILVNAGAQNIFYDKQSWSCTEATESCPWIMNFRWGRAEPTGFTHLDQLADQKRGSRYTRSVFAF